MTDTTRPDYPGGGQGVPPTTGASEASSNPSGTQGGMREQASELGQEAKASGQHVAGVAKEEGKRVAGEISDQARQLYDQTRGELKDQAASQQQRVAGGLRNIGDDLVQMRDGSPPSEGMARDLVTQASERVSAIADWLEAREPGDLVNEVKSFARRRPGVYIAAAVGVGLLAGRLTRALVSSARDEAKESGTTGRMPAPGSAPRTPSVPPPVSAPPTSTGMPATGGPGGVGNPLETDPLRRPGLAE
ncbi:hypothetical protein [Diaminobutyricimonas sp. LJ205]|uniref:hypothetical protein n=1 Tax=Diaminobutyricimonas sp. LJ205 TaxID=2683590 RepID=UPI0012F51B23|nr:hypothetical protein [Diaminobutyricimonas sp. LJ205]